MSPTCAVHVTDLCGVHHTQKPLKPAWIKALRRFGSDKLYMFIQGPGLLAPNRPYGYGLPASQWGQGYRRCSRARPLRSLPSASFQQVEKMPKYRSSGCYGVAMKAKRNGF